MREPGEPQVEFRVVDQHQKPGFPGQDLRLEGLQRTSDFPVMAQDLHQPDDRKLGGIDHQFDAGFARGFAAHAGPGPLGMPGT